MRAGLVQVCPTRERDFAPIEQYRPWRTHNSFHGYPTTLLPFTSSYSNISNLNSVCHVSSYGVLPVVMPQCFQFCAEDGNNG